MLSSTARKIYNTNSTKVIGLFYSRKMRQHVPFESTLERDWLLWLEFDPIVQSIISQPNTFKASGNEFVSSYTPDVAVRLLGRPRLLCYEVKPYSVAKSQIFLQRFSSCQQLLRQAGFDLQCVTEKDIRKEPQLTNLKRLSAFARGPALSDDAWRKLQAALIESPQRIDVVLKSLNLRLEEIYHTIFIGKLTTDMETSITRCSVIDLPEASDAS